MRSEHVSIHRKRPSAHDCGRIFITSGVAEPRLDNIIQILDVAEHFGQAPVTLSSFLQHNQTRKQGETHTTAPSPTRNQLDVSSANPPGNCSIDALWLCLFSLFNFVRHDLLPTGVQQNMGTS